MNREQLLQAATTDTMHNGAKPIMTIHERAKSDLAKTNQWWFDRLEEARGEIATLKAENAEKQETIGRCFDAITDTSFRLIMANKEIDRLGGEAQ